MKHINFYSLFPYSFEVDFFVQEFFKDFKVHLWGQKVLFIWATRDYISHSYI